MWLECGGAGDENFIKRLACFFRYGTKTTPTILPED